MNSITVKTHYTANEIAELCLESAPKSKKNVIEKAKRENWTARKRVGRGGGLEYEFAALPEQIRAEILLKHRPQPTAVLAKPQSADVDTQALWAQWGQANTRNQAIALFRQGVVSAVVELVAHSIRLLDAIEQVVGKIAAENAEKGVDYRLSIGSVKRWYYAVKDAPHDCWLPLLLEERGKNRTALEAEISPEAWAYFKADYLRIENPQFGSCYERLKHAALARDWIIPSRSSLKRKLDREIPLAQQVYLRQGEYALSRLYPALKRSVADLAVMEWINGDGYQHNVWVKWHNGAVKRPKTWIWQDVRTRMILGYRTDLSENTDMIRLALLDVISKYGIPQHITIDNTRAAANKKMTGGVKNRYRFTVKEDEVQGIIPALGIQIHWTSVQFGKGRGQAKPVERAFSHGGLGELIDLHPSLAGFHTGRNAYLKPEYEQAPEGGVPYDTFILALEAGIQMFNEREARKTEICRGKLSFKQAFERDIQQAELRMPTPEQMRLLLTLHEEVSLKDNGTFELKAGGQVNGLRNRYEALPLIGSTHKRIVVRYDPSNLHGTVWAYSLDGRYLCEAQCTQAVAFGDTQAGQDHGRKMREYVRHTKKAAKAQQELSIKEAATYLPEVEIDEADYVEMPNIATLPSLAPSLLPVVGSNALKAEAWLEEDEEQEQIEQTLRKGLAIIINEKGR